MSINKTYTPSTYPCNIACTGVCAFLELYLEMRLQIACLLHSVRGHPYRTSALRGEGGLAQKKM